MMKVLILFVVTLCVLKTTCGYCYIKQDKGTFCTAPNGATIPEGANLQIPEKCEQCSCSKSSPLGDNDLMLSCCGYGKNAGVFMPPEGCKTVVGDDGCSIKLVQIVDDTLLC